MKEEYIKKSDLLKDRYIYCEDCDPITGETVKEVIGIVDYILYAEIEDMSGADVRENIHGEWNLQEINEDHDYEWVCSKCKKRNDVKTNFCPNCGADMRGETNE